MNTSVWFDADQALDALDTALDGAECDHLEVAATSRTGEHTRFAGDRIHQAQSIVECQIMVRAVVGTGSARFAVNSFADLKRAVGAAVTLASERDGVAGALTSNAVARGPIDDDTKDLWFDSTLEWDVTERSRLAGLLMSEAQRSGGTVNGNFMTAISELVVATSGGVRAHGSATEAGFTMTVRFGDASSYVGDLSRDASMLRVMPRAIDAIADTSRVRSVIPVPDGVHDVVFGPLAAGELIGFVPDFGFLAPAVRAGIGLVAQHPGDVVASPLITISDDAKSPVGLPFPFDFEGSQKRRVTLIDAGRVGDAVSDLANAQVTEGSTGHASIGREQSPEPACANLIMDPGTDGEDELIAGVERGLYVQRLWYNRLVDAESGTVVGTSRDACFLIEDGQKTRALASGRFNESVIDALARTDALSVNRCSQPIPNLWNGCITAPAMRVRGFQFGTRTRNEEIQ
jgi:PmbA protein